MIRRPNKSLQLLFLAVVVAVTLYARRTGAATQTI